jgi:hypothetical protein
LGTGDGKSRCEGASIWDDNRKDKRRQEQPQIPFGDDNQKDRQQQRQNKGKGKSKSKGKGKSKGKIQGSFDCVAHEVP